MEHRTGVTRSASGSHLVEDPGDSLTRVCEQIGVTLTHSARSDSMPFWDDGWQPIQEYYGREAKHGLKRCIEALLGPRLRRPRHARPPVAARVDGALHRCDEGVYLVWEAISVLEQITAKWWEHSASENLYARKLHYERNARPATRSGRWVAGRSCGARWPTRSWGSAADPAAGHGRAGGRRETARARGASCADPDEPGPRRGHRRRRGGGQRPGLGPARAVRRRRRCRGTCCSAIRYACRQPQPRLLARLLDRREGAGDRDDRARDGLVLVDAADRTSRVHPELHRLRPRRLTARRIPHLRGRRVRRHRALRRQGLVSTASSPSCGSTSRR